ncbi:MAG: hypothetical protein AAF830_01050 [Pseudomonadota bacterium]
MRRFARLALLPIPLALAQPVYAGEWEAGGEVAAELRVFAELPTYPGQLEDFQSSGTFTGDLRWSSDDRKHQVVVVPFFRLDAEDSERTHGDLREGYYRYAGDEVDILIGAAKVFWGTTESRHLVDVINQTDAVEDIDEEDKLGQPMVKISLLKEWGKLDFFVLPYFRERTFPGRRGRLRFDPVIETDDPIFEDEDEEWNTDFAVRYSHYIGSVDFGLSAFSGTSREPGFNFDVDESGAARLRPVYDQINQLGVDFQYTQDAWLWKFEGIVREGQGNTFAAAVAGVEYTLFGITESGADLGLLAEYLYDGRDDDFTAPPTPLENDLFLGARYALNDAQDTSILAGTITDLDDGSSSGLIEAERRLGANWTAELEARFFFGVEDDNLLAAFRDDSVATFRITRYF